MIDLDELERLAREATPGPWTHYTLADGAYVEQPTRGSIGIGFRPDGEPDTQDAAFIAAANPAAILELVAELREARAIVRMVGDDNVDADPRLTVSAMAYRAKWGK